jgi:hypothetical protein
MNRHQKLCACFVCEAIASGQSPEDVRGKLAESEQKMIEEHGWYIHYVSGDDKVLPLGLNAHTHGLWESRRHPNFQIVLPINPQVIHSIFWNLFRQVEDGEIFLPDHNYDKIIQDFAVRCIAAWECKRPVLRVILPDADGNLLEPDMAPNYAMQYTHLRTT